MSGLVVRTDTFRSPTAATAATPSASGPSPSPLGSPAWTAHSARGVNGNGAAPSTPLSAGSPSPSPSASSPANGSAANGSAASVSSNILVAVRLRPLSEREKSQGDASIWRTSAATTTIEETRDAIGKQYNFDYICPPEETTTDLYKHLVRKTVLKACIGYNSNVFAYGQTASGKTHTTLGNEFSPGIVLLAIGDIFHYIAQSPNRQFLLRISCLEIYNEEINDLLATGPNSLNLKLENVGGLNKDGTLNPLATNTGVKIRGLTQEFVRSPAEFISLLLRGEENRKIASTDANLRSSRSHTMFRVHIESRARATPGAPPTATSKKIRSSLLTFVDLAGSECISQLGGSLDRQKECRAINRSLLGLSRVVVALSSGADSNGGHVPYRDSRLTRILKPALGGNSHTLFICCMSINQVCREESHNTLRFGSFANQVTNVAKVNLKEEVVIKQDIVKYSDDLERMRLEMEARRAEELAELERLREANDQLRNLLKMKDQHLEQTTADATAAQLAAQAAADAVLESQRLLSGEREERERLALEAAEAAERGAGEEDERAYLRMQLKISQAQIKLLEEKMVPMVEDANQKKSDGARDADSHLASLMETVASLRDANAALAASRARDRAEYDAERQRIDAEKDALLKSLLADQIAESQRLEGRIAVEQQSLQQARIVAMCAGMEVLKCCRGKDAAHSVRLWLEPGTSTSPEHRLCWSRTGMAGALKSSRSLPLKSVEKLKLGQSSQPFERAPPPLQTHEVQQRSFSLVTPTRTLDLIVATTVAFDLWVAGLGPFLSRVREEEHRPGAEAAAARKKKTEEEAAERERKSRAVAAVVAAASSSSSSPPANASTASAAESSPALPHLAASSSSFVSSSSSASSSTSSFPSSAPIASAIPPLADSSSAVAVHIINGEPAAISVGSASAPPINPAAKDSASPPAAQLESLEWVSSPDDD